MLPRTDRIRTMRERGWNLLMNGYAVQGIRLLDTAERLMRELIDDGRRRAALRWAGVAYRHENN